MALRCVLGFPRWTLRSQCLFCICAGASRPCALGEASGQGAAYAVLRLRGPSLMTGSVTRRASLALPMLALLCQRKQPVWLIGLFVVHASCWSGCTCTPLRALAGCAQLKTPAQRKAFTQLVKRVARLEEIPAGSGTKYIVLRSPAS